MRTDNIISYTGDEYCSVCGELLKKGEVIPKTGEDCDFVIVSQPVDFAGNEGDTARFEVVAEGEGLSYQWYYSNDGGVTWSKSNMTGADTDTLRVRTIESRNGQMYRCWITDESGSYQRTNAATLYIGEKPVISSQPESYSGAVNTNAVFHVEATGEGLSYQWYYRDGNNNWAKSGQADAKTDTLTVAIKSYMNNRQYRCEITNANGMVTTSDYATLTVAK